MFPTKMKPSGLAFIHLILKDMECKKNIKAN